MCLIKWHHPLFAMMSPQPPELAGNGGSNSYHALTAYLPALKSRRQARERLSGLPRRSLPPLPALPLLLRLPRAQNPPETSLEPL